MATADGWRIPVITEMVCNSARYTPTQTGERGYLYNTEMISVQAPMCELMCALPVYLEV